MDLHDTELKLLEIINAASPAPDNGKLTQRDLARATGLSLGMVNGVLKRFSELGLLKITYLSSKSVRYELTAAGVEEMGRRAAGTLERSALGGMRYRANLEAFVARAKAEGATTLVLSGQSELLFTIESICEEYGIVLVKSVDPERARSLGRRPGVVLLASEKAGPEEGAIALASVIASANVGDSAGDSAGERTLAE